MKARYEKVTVLAPARLHMGFIDLSGALGRDFGSIGIGLNEINTSISMQGAAALTVTGPSAARALKCTRQLCLALQVSENLQIDISAAIPEHIGLGSARKWLWLSAWR